MKNYFFLDLNDGLSQNERNLPFLSPDYVKIDDRNIFRLAYTIYKYASLFNYYDANDSLDGDWRSFLGSDNYIIDSVVSSVDDKKQLELINQLKENILNHHDEQSIFGELKEVFSTIIYFGKYLLEILSAAKIRNFHTESHAADTRKALITLYELSLKIRTVQSFELEHELEGILPVPGPHEHGGAPSKRLTQRNDIGELIDEIDDVVTSLIRIFNYVKGRVKHDSLAPNKDIPPHISLIAAFLHLFSRLQGQINAKTAEHLDYYYLKILGLSLNAPEPDKVHLLFGVADNVEEHELNEGSLVYARVDDAGTNVDFEIDNDTFLYNGRVSELKTLFLNDGEGGDGSDRLEINRADNPLNEIAKLIKNPDGQVTWPLFGESLNSDNLARTTNRFAEIGKVVSSPLLFLESGDRSVSVKFFFLNSNGGISLIDDRYTMEDYFDIDITSTDGWMDVASRSAIARYFAKTNCIEFSFRLRAEDPPMVEFNPVLHGTEISVSYPAIRIRVKNNMPASVYRAMKTAEIERITINVEVRDFTDLTLENNLGPLSASKPFQMFGAIPTVGSYLDLRNTNAFNKYTMDADVFLEWFDLPRARGGFKTYYQQYFKGIDTDSFKISISSSLANAGKADDDDVEYLDLFQNDDDDYICKTTVIELRKLKKIQFEKGMSLSQEKTDVGFSKGALRLELIAPSVAFGHQAYPQIYADVILSSEKLPLGKKIKAFFLGAKKRSPILPAPPFMPVLRKISVNYKLEQNINFTSNDKTNEIQLVHLYPFGRKFIYPQSNIQIRMLPGFRFSGNLFMGIQGAIPGAEISLLVVFDSSIAVHDPAGLEQVTWTFLHDNDWVDIDNTDLLSDTTNGLITNGIVRIRIPSRPTTGNTILNPDLFWLSAGVNDRATIKVSVTGIYMNASTARRVTKTLVTTSLIDYKLPANTIKGFKINNQKVENIFQPFCSYDGKPAQLKKDFYVSASERLRHKNRPLTFLDINQMILDQFPDILIAKCINTADRNYNTQNLKVVVIPRQHTTTRNIVPEFKVGIGTLKQISDYIKQRLSPFVDIRVENVEYEKIKIICSVVFKNDKQTATIGFLTKKLNEDIQSILCPWLYNAESEIKIGADLEVLKLQQSIKMLPYVKNITGFSVLHFFEIYDVASGKYTTELEDTTYTKQLIIQPSCPEAVFISSDQHRINVIKEEEYKESERGGINNLILGNELIVGLKESNDDPDGDQNEHRKFNLSITI